MFLVCVPLHNRRKRCILYLTSIQGDHTQFNFLSRASLFFPFFFVCVRVCVTWNEKQRHSCCHVANLTRKKCFSGRESNREKKETILQKEKKKCESHEGQKIFHFGFFFVTNFCFFVLLRTSNDKHYFNNNDFFFPSFLIVTTAKNRLEKVSVQQQNHALIFFFTVPTRAPTKSFFFSMGKKN